MHISEQLCDAKCNCSIYKQHHASCNTTACACHIMLDVYHRQMDIFIACKLAIIEHSKSKHVSIMMAHASQKERICKIRTLNQRNPQLALLLQSSNQCVCGHDEAGNISRSIQACTQLLSEAAAPPPLLSAWP